MKPKTKLQHQVVELSKKLPKITEKQESWAFKHCLDHKATKLKNGTVTCLDCGHKWKDDQLSLLTAIDGCTCPNCHTKLQVTDTRKQKFYDWAYYSIITTFQGFQVIRFFKVHGNYKAGKPAYVHCYEVTQLWIAPNGKYEIIANCHSTGCYAETWTGDFVLRGKFNTANYNLQAYKIYPSRPMLTEIKRNGFTGKYHGLTPFTLFHLILSNSNAETLLKSGQYSLLKHCASREKEIKELWPTIKICIRNKFIIKDATLWIDYIKYLQYFNKDTLNAKYTCPENLHEVHDKWMNKKRQEEEKIRAEDRKKQAKKDEAAFKKLKGKFFGIVFSDGEIEVKVLESALEYLDEGAAMHHCVGSYALRKDSLVFSARIYGKRIETIEVSLENLKIMQSRGACNKNTEYHDRIISLVNKNMHLIKERLKPKKNGTKRNVTAAA